MITWFTRFSFGRTAQDLSTRTLGYQIEQASQIYNALSGQGESSVEDNHPILRMWEGHEFALAVYGMELGLEIVADRRQVDNVFFDLYSKIQSFKKEYAVSYVKPPWFEDADLCRSHRSNLMRREPSVYGDTWPRTPEEMPYLWPFLSEDGQSYELMVSKEERAMLKSGERKLPTSIKRRVANL